MHVSKRGRVSGSGLEIDIWEKIGHPKLTNFIYLMYLRYSYKIVESNYVVFFAILKNRFKAPLVFNSAVVEKVFFFIQDSIFV